MRLLLPSSGKERPCRLSLSLGFFRFLLVAMAMAMADSLCRKKKKMVSYLDETRFENSSDQLGMKMMKEVFIIWNDI